MDEVVIVVELTEGCRSGIVAAVNRSRPLRVTAALRELGMRERRGGRERKGKEGEEGEGYQG
eukprot:751520-Hanusia_phi.AAC.2